MFHLHSQLAQSSVSVQGILAMISLILPPVFRCKQQELHILPL